MIPMLSDEGLTYGKPCISALKVNFDGAIGLQIYDQFIVAFTQQLSPDA